MRNFLLLQALLLAGCTSFNSRVLNSPEFTAMEKTKFHLAVIDESGNEVANLTARSIHVFALNWLSSNGYELTKNPKEADFVVLFVPTAKKRELQYGPTSFTMPIQGVNQNHQTNYQVRNMYGQSVGSVTTNESRPTVLGYQTINRPGYTRTVYDRALKIEVAESPLRENYRVISSGAISPKDYDDPFYDNEIILKKAVEQLLKETTLSKRSPANS